MKKLLSLLLLAAMLLALCACAASPAQPTGETTAAFEDFQKRGDAPEC